MTKKDTHQWQAFILNIFDKDDNRVISNRHFFFVPPLTLNSEVQMWLQILSATHNMAALIPDLLNAYANSVCNTQGFFLQNVLTLTSYWGLHGNLCGSVARPHADTVPPSGRQLAACVSASRSAPGVRPSGWEWTARGAPASGSVLWGTCPWWRQPWHLYTPKQKKKKRTFLPCVTKLTVKLDAYNKLLKIQGDFSYLHFRVLHWCL